MDCRFNSKVSQFSVAVDIAPGTTPSTGDYKRALDRVIQRQCININLRKALHMAALSTVRVDSQKQKPGFIEPSEVW